MSDPVLANLFNDLQAIANEPAPAIGDTLTAVLAGATPLSVPTRRTRSRRLVLVALASTGALTAGVGAAAAADRLPEPLQRVVAKVVNGVTPFDVPGAPVEPEGPPTTGPVTDDSDSTANRSESSDDASERADDRDDTRSDDDGHEGDAPRSGVDGGDDSDGGDVSHPDESDGGDSSSNDGSDGGNDGGSDSSDSSDSGSDSSDSSDSGSDNSDNSDSDSSDDH